ncbi:hypothetical protein D3C87_1533820 [compost metagenome]
MMEKWLPEQQPLAAPEFFQACRPFIAEPNHDPNSRCQRDPQPFAPAPIAADARLGGVWISTPCRRKYRHDPTGSDQNVA